MQNKELRSHALHLFVSGTLGLSEVKILGVFKAGYLKDIQIMMIRLIAQGIPSSCNESLSKPLDHNFKSTDQHFSLKAVPYISLQISILTYFLR